jgi:hypothetical protein
VTVVWIAFVTAMLSRWPAVPANVTRAIWPTRLKFSVSEGPSITSVAVSSSDRVSVMLRMSAPLGSIRMVYVPVVGSGGMMMLKSELPVEAESRVPSGFQTVTASKTVAPGKPRFSRWPTVPENVSRALWPGRVIFTGTEAPPTAMVPTTRSCDSVIGLAPL